MASTFENEIWVGGIAAKDDTRLRETHSQGSKLYKILDSRAGYFFGRSRRYNSDSEYGSDSDTGGASSGDSESSLPRLTTSSSKSSNGLFRKQKSVSKVDSESDSDTEGPRAKMSFSFLKSTFAAETSQSRSADSGSNAESSSSTDIFRNILNAPKAARSSSEHPPLPTPKQLSPINQRGSCTPDTRSISSSSQSNSESSLNEKYGAASKTELGHGATAIVRLCISMSGDNKKYAIKEFNSKKKNEDQKSYIKKLTSEFNISSSLLHENIVRTVDLIQDDRKKWCAVMEYSEGGDLFSKIQGGSLHDQTLIDCFFKQIVAGVAYLHAVGVAHRDLKPENILLDKSCRILKITDFGVSTVFHLPLETKSTKCIGQCGSGPYMAPEVYLLKPYDPALVDVWSIGIIYYVMTFSSMPWLESRISDMRYKKYLDAFGAFGPIERLSPLKRQLMYRMIHPDVKKRINICKITSSEWISKISVCREGTSESEGGVTHSHACLSVL